MARQMDPKDLAGIAIIYSKVTPSESPVFISYCGSKEWTSTYRPSPSILFGDGFAKYMKNLQSQANIANINKNFAIYPKGLKLNMMTIAMMQPGIALLDCGNNVNVAQNIGLLAISQNIGLLAILCATSKNGCNVPKEVIDRFSVSVRGLALMMGIDEYKQRFYPRASEQKLHEVREKMRVFLNLPDEDANEKSNAENETDNTSSVW